MNKTKIPVLYFLLVELTALEGGMSQLPIITTNKVYHMLEGSKCYKLMKKWRDKDNEEYRQKIIVILKKAAVIGLTENKTIEQRFKGDKNVASGKFGADPF